MDHTQHLLLALAAVLVLGTAAQWIAWKIRLPSILLLLAFGLAAGPLTGLVQPDELLGPLLFPIVSLSVAIILFEGSLSLHVDELREIGRVLFNLLTIGVVVTWVLTTGAAHWILGFSLFKSLLLGAVLVVTGPTVIGPLLRHVRPIGRVGPIARWEGIVIDPVGAVLALLVFEAHIAMAEGNVEQATWHAAMGLARTVVFGGGLGAAVAWVTAFVLRRHLVPDHLQSPVVLMLVLMAFVASNALQHESGLLAVTVMGVVLANSEGVILQPILEFKENLSLLLISSLFILLSSRLDLSTFQELGWRGPLFVLVMILLVRPASVMLSTLGSRLEWRERVFLSWLAPRGIVAAAVASVFALRLGMEPPLPEVSAEVAQGVITEIVGQTPEPIESVSSLDAPGRGLVPATFLVIFGTVVVYGLTAAPLARRLGLASANPQGVLIAGADLVSRQIGTALQEAGYPVLLVDTNRWNIQAARMAGLRTAHENILSEQAIADLDLGGIGRFLGFTPNDEVNSLAAMHLAPLFGRANVYQLTPHDQTDGREPSAGHLRARFLFSPVLTHRELESRLERGAKLKTTKLTDEFTFDRFKATYGPATVPLFLTGQGRLTILTSRNAPIPKAGQAIIALIDPQGAPRPATNETELATEATA
ncbi:MAG: cation:proton antiporter [Planctomycetaceae bacterium]